METTEFSIGLASLGFSFERIDESIQQGCVLAAITRTPPEIALDAIHSRVNASGIACNESEIEIPLVEAYQQHASAEQERLAFEKERDPYGLLQMSPINPYGLSPHEFLRKIYQPSQRIALYDGQNHRSIWTDDSEDNGIPICSTAGIRFWPLPCSKSGPGTRASDGVDSWLYVLALGNSSQWAKLIAERVPVIAVITTRPNFTECIALLKFDAVRNRKEWMARRDRLMTLFNQRWGDICHLDKLAPLPGTVSKRGIHRLIYFNPDATAIA